MKVFQKAATSTQQSNGKVFVCCERGMFTLKENLPLLMCASCTSNFDNPLPELPPDFGHDTNKLYQPL